MKRVYRIEYDRWGEWNQSVDWPAKYSKSEADEILVRQNNRNNQVLNYRARMEESDDCEGIEG
jgi:hypothetical protein